MPRTLPSAPEAEASLLGNMMVYPNAARAAMEEGLNEEDFFIDANRRIFLACESLYRSGTPIDLTTVATRLKDMELLDRMGGLEYLTDLSQAAITSANTSKITRKGVTTVTSLVLAGPITTVSEIHGIVGYCLFRPPVMYSTRFCRV